MVNTTKIAKSNIKHNKSKSILLIITIILSSLLLTAVATTAVNWNNFNKERVSKYFGSYHLILKGLDDEELRTAKNHADVDKVGIINSLGIIEYDDESSIGFGYMDKNALEFNQLEFIEGNMPQNENEIVLDDVALDKLGYNKELNQKIKLKYGDFSLQDIIEKEFTLVGITKASETSIARKSYTGIFSKEYMINTRDMSKENFNVLLTVKNAKHLSGEEIKLKANKIGNDIGLSKANIIVNEDYINSQKPDIEIVIGAVIISLIIIVSSILVIYNIFYMSIVSKVQEFGKLRAIGARKKQIKAIIFKEGIYLAIIGIPIGVILGYTIGEFIVSNLMQMRSSSFNLYIVIAVVIMSLFTVVISLLKPMKIASRISIVEAIKFNGNDKGIKSRKGYAELDLKKLAYANIKRNKKRTYITILSLTLSGIIFISMATILNSMDAKIMATNHFPYDIKISLDNYTYGDDESPKTEINILQANNPLSSDFINEIKNIDGVTEVSTAKDLKAQLKDYKAEFKYQSLGSIDEDDLEELNLYLESGEINLDKLKSGDEIIFTYSDLAKELNINVGDKITLILYDGNKEIEKEFIVQAITDGSGDLAIHEDAFSKIVKSNANVAIGFNINKSKYKDVKTIIENMIKDNGHLEMKLLEDEIAIYEISIFTTKAIAYCLVTIIGIIGFMNLINSMISSIITRKKELGMLQAIGLTNKQLIKMLNIEAAFYIVNMLIGTLSVGSLIGYVGVMIFRSTGASYAVYKFPILQVIIMICSIVVALLLLTYLITKNFNKESLVDRVRYSE